MLALSPARTAAPEHTDKAKLAELAEASRRDGLAAVYLDLPGTPA